MSLLDDVSIVVTPNGYKAGTLYAVIPSNEDGDMDVTRATDATRVDEDGLIEDVLSNVPRIDYTGGGCPHILVEPERTNLLLYSEDFSQSSWNQTTADVTVTTNTNPSGRSGTYSVERVTGSQLGDSFSITSGNDYTTSWYVRNISGTGAIIIKDTNNSTNNFTATSEWQRFSVTATATSGTGRCYLQVPTTNDVVEVWGAQFEEGSYATSYIPTSGSSVTRNQDQFTRDGIGSLIGQTEGTFFIELSKPTTIMPTLGLITLNNAASNSDRNSVAIGFFGSDDFFLRVQSNNVSVFSSSNIVTSKNIFYKVAISYKSGESLIYVDGSPVTPNQGSLAGTFTFGVTLDNLSFDYNGNNVLPFYGKVKQLQVYDTALTGDQLTDLTS